MPRSEDVDATIRERLRAWLWHYKRRRGWTNERLADEIGVATTTVTNVLNGVRSGGLDLLVRMHHKLHHSADDFLDTDPPQPAPAPKPKK